MVQEHVDMIKSITGAGPYSNQGMQVAESTMTAIMGRESAYSGLKVTWDMIMSSKQKSYPRTRQSIYSGRVGEAETGGYSSIGLVATRRSAAEGVRVQIEERAHAFARTGVYKFV
jgi:hypothetical protein